MQLLVSVRSVEEAAAALEGGAGLIDVKEPSRGSLGRADDERIRQIVHFIKGRRPVSAACGELRETDFAPPCIRGLNFIKWGLAGLGGETPWRDALARAAGGLHSTSCRPVVAAYADWRRAKAPRPEEVCTFACEQHWGAFLLDTWQKDGRTLLDFLTPPEVADLAQRCRAAGVRVALAGSLGVPQIAALRVAGPDWFAVRGAACRGGDRDAAVDAAAVRQLADLLLARPRSLEDSPAGLDAMDAGRGN
jgi:uncharacterized protein (UPF0264 family)